MDKVRINDFCGTETMGVECNVEYCPKAAVVVNARLEGSSLL